MLPEGHAHVAPDAGGEGHLCDQIAFMWSDAIKAAWAADDASRRTP